MPMLPTSWRLNAPHATAGQIVAEVVAHGDAAPVIIYSDEEAEAADVPRRARLIAAAPAMLEQLRICAAELSACATVLRTDDGRAQAATWAARVRRVISDIEEGC